MPPSPAALDATCPWCMAQQLVPVPRGTRPPFRFICGNCKDQLTYRGRADYKRQFDEIQALKRRYPKWRELDVPAIRSLN